MEYIGLSFEDGMYKPIQQITGMLLPNAEASNKEPIFQVMWKDHKIGQVPYHYLLNCDPLIEAFFQMEKDYMKSNFPKVAQIPNLMYNYYADFRDRQLVEDDIIQYNPQDEINQDEYFNYFDDPSFQLP